MTLFHKDADYEALERVLNQGLHRYPVDLFAYQWMPKPPARVSAIVQNVGQECPT